MTDKKPNLLFVFADQLRASSVGYVGEEAVRTPNIDAFAGTGTIYKNAVSMLPVCGPFRGSLITGRTPTTTGLVINDIPLKTDEVSIGHCFKDAGYDTAYIGKWHLDGPNRPAPVPPGPRRQGFFANYAYSASLRCMHLRDAAASVTAHAARNHGTGDPGCPAIDERGGA